VLRPCLECGRLTQWSRCADHRTQRGSATARGYGSAWQRTSARIIAGDGGVCSYCGGVADTTDHVIPRSRGGTDDDSNLVAACRPCNSRKKDRHG
jgi:5-methylcytosine-specific restriction endonuclease McrA